MDGDGRARLISRVAERLVRPRRLARAVRHVAGPESVGYGPGEVLAICVVRNGEAYVRPFLEHHLGLGVAHVVFLDNGSTDGTVERARELDRVTILSCDLPYEKYENVMKRYLAHRFSRGRWNLCVDVDELFEYPFSNVLPLPALLEYLNRHRYTAVVAQMLDMLPEGALREARIAPGRRLEESFPFYDVTDVRRAEYPFGNLSNPAVKMHWGGIRKAMFGTDNGLTKAALVKVDDSVDLFVKYHHAENVRIADFTAVLLHFPFTDAFAGKVADAVATGRYGPLTTREYEGYARALAAGGDSGLRRPSARRLGRIEELVDAGFLVVSEDYLRWVDAHR